MSDPIRWGVIGTGRISETFVPDLRSVRTGTVTAVWGRRAETAAEFAAKHAIFAHTDSLDEVFGRDDVDAVYIATPPATHTPIAMRALDAGKHVLIEKPMATCAAEAAQVFERAAEVDRFAMEAMWMKFNPLHQEVAELVASGTIGTPRHVRAGFGMPFPPGGSRWSAELGGSTIFDQGIYAVTLATWMLGPILEVHATGRVRDGVDVAAHLTLHHADGKVAQVGCSIEEFIDPSAGVSGTAGWIEIPAMFWATDAARIHAGSPRALFHEPDVRTRAREGNGYVPMIRAVNEAIASGVRQHPHHEASDTIAVARILDAARAAVLEAS